MGENVMSDSVPVSCPVCAEAGKRSDIVNVCGCAPHWHCTLNGSNWGWWMVGGAGADEGPGPWWLKKSMMSCVAC